jgi:hypothetical protein
VVQAATMIKLTLFDTAAGMATAFDPVPTDPGHSDFDVSSRTGSRSGQLDAHVPGECSPSAGFPYGGVDGPTDECLGWLQPHSNVAASKHA